VRRSARLLWVAPPALIVAGPLPASAAVYLSADEAAREIFPGLTLASVCLMHINTGYLYRNGAIDLTELFMIQDLSEAVAKRRTEVPGRLAQMSHMLLQTEAPSIKPDRHCHIPYDCPFWDHCTKDKPARWIHYLPGSKQVVDQLTQQGVMTIDEIPAGTKLSVVQRRVKENIEWVSPKLGPVLKTVQYPIHHLDFETVMLPVPALPLGS